jgi:hypothetical protein
MNYAWKATCVAWVLLLVGGCRGPAVTLTEVPMLIGTPIVTLPSGSWIRLLPDPAEAFAPDGFCGDIESYEGQLGSAFSSLLADPASQSDSFIDLWNTYEGALDRTGQNVRAEFYEGGDQWALVEFRTDCGYSGSYFNFSNLYVFSRTGDNWAVPEPGGYGNVGSVRWLGEGNGWLVETHYESGGRGYYTNRLLHVQPEGRRGSDVLAELKRGSAPYSFEFVIDPNSNRLIVFPDIYSQAVYSYCEIETDEVGTVDAYQFHSTVKEFEMLDGRYSLRDEKSDATVLSWEWDKPGQYSWFVSTTEVRSIDENGKPIDLDWLVELWEAECKDAN